MSPPGSKRPPVGKTGGQGLAGGHSAGAPNDTRRNRQVAGSAVDPRTLELIRHGGQDGSRVAWHVALGIRNAGMTITDYIAVMTDPLNGCSRWYRDLRDGRPKTANKHRKTGRGHDRAVALLVTTWRKVAQLPEPRRMDTSDVHERCQRAMTAADQRLTGRTRGTRLRVLAALCTEARHYRTTRVLAPVRTIALEAGVSRQTAWRALLDLNSIGVLRHIVTNTSANVFELTDCTIRRTDLPHTRREKSVPRKVHLDVWRHTDLGASGLLIHTMLDEEPQRIADLARGTGLHRNTVGRRVRDLAARGLASETPDGWCIGAGDPAQAVGPARGSRHRDAERYEAERRAYRLVRSRRVAS